MLTNNDIKLFEKSTRKIVREEITNETEDLKSRFEAEMKLSRMRIENSLHDLTDRIKNLEIKVTYLEKSNKEIIKEIKKIRKDLSTNINLSDKMEIYLDKRIKTIEKKLDIETPEFAISQI